MEEIVDRREMFCQKIQTHIFKSAFKNKSKISLGKKKPTHFGWAGTVFLVERLVNNLC